MSASHLLDLNTPWRYLLQIPGWRVRIEREREEKERKGVKEEWEDGYLSSQSCLNLNYDYDFDSIS